MQVCGSNTLTDEVDDTVGHTQGTSGLDTTTDVLDAGLALADLGVDTVRPIEELSGKDLEAGRDSGTGQAFKCLDRTGHGHLDLKLALAETEREELGDEGGVAGFGDNVLSGDTESDGTKGDKSRDVGSGEEDTVIPSVSARAGCRWYNTSRTNKCCAEQSH